MIRFSQATDQNLFSLPSPTATLTPKASSSSLLSLSSPLPSLDQRPSTATQGSTTARKQRFSIHCPHRGVVGVIANMCQERGWVLAPSAARADAAWVITNDEVKRRLASGNPGQFISKIPGFHELCAKCRLAEELGRVQRLFPEQYAFWPENYNLPADANRLREAMNGYTVYIAKPNHGSQGEGIFLATNWNDMLANMEGLDYAVQRYISKPFLVENTKFDMRVYVLVTSVEPLRVYVCKDGLARFCATTYKAPNVNNLHVVTSHLTNYSLNKRSSAFVHSDDPTGGDSSKRSLAHLFRQLRRQGVDVALIWARIHELIINTLQAFKPTLLDVMHSHPKQAEIRKQCFHLLGFDILLDNMLQPWLLEINSNPSLSIDAVYNLEQYSRLYPEENIPGPSIPGGTGVGVGVVNRGSPRLCRCSDGPEGAHIHRVCPLDLAVKTIALSGAFAVIKRERKGKSPLTGKNAPQYTIIMDGDLEIERVLGTSLDVLTEVRELFEDVKGPRKSADLHRLRRFAMRCGISVAQRPSRDRPQSSTSELTLNPTLEEFERWVCKKTKNFNANPINVSITRDQFTSLVLDMAALLYRDDPTCVALQQLVNRYKQSFSLLGPAKPPRPPAVITARTTKLDALPLPSPPGKPTSSLLMKPNSSRRREKKFLITSQDILLSLLSKDE